MKNVIVLIIVIFSTFNAQAEFQLRKKEFGAYEIKNFQCSLDTVISEPYAIVEFKYNFNQIKATETHYLTLTTEFACKQFKLDSTGTVQSIVNDSFIEFRIEDQNGKEFMHEYAKYIMPGKRSVFVLNRKCEKPLDTEPKIVPIQTIQRKPVIYLYGNTGEQYEVKIPKSTALIATYPKPVNNVWKVKILENDLIEFNNKKYPYLFWEATRVMNKAWSTGYTVSKENIISFLEQKLTEMNLNFKEKTDFITYWAPRMMQFDSYDIHFTFNEEYKTEVADIKVTPKPESEFRVFMQYRKHTSTILKEQKIEKAIRTNSMYLEWGGSNDLEK